MKFPANVIVDVQRISRTKVNTEINGALLTWSASLVSRISSKYRTFFDCVVDKFYQKADEMLQHCCCARD